MNTPPLNPDNVILVVKSDGKERGRMAATDSRANSWLSYGNITVDYVDDPEAAQAYRMLSTTIFRR